MADKFAPQSDAITAQSLQTSAGVTVQWAGPPLSEGPMPAVFYFFTTGLQSLTRDPYNQVVQALKGARLRVFSLTVPHHSPEMDNGSAMQRWSDAIHGGEDPLGDFVLEVKDTLNYLHRQGITLEDQVAVSGLSRGAYIATHVAAADARIRAILGFAPLTDAVQLKEFGQLVEHPIVKAQRLEHLIPEILDRNLRFYIGNRDQRVGTDHCFNFIHKLADAAFEARIRSPQIELIIGPSIGFRGHGTGPEAFASGAEWIQKQLRVEERADWED